MSNRRHPEPDAGSLVAVCPSCDEIAQVDYVGEQLVLLFCPMLAPSGEPHRIPLTDTAWLEASS